MGDDDVVHELVLARDERFEHCVDERRDCHHRAAIGLDVARDVGSRSARITAEPKRQHPRGGDQLLRKVVAHVGDDLAAVRRPFPSEVLTPVVPVAEAF